MATMHTVGVSHIDWSRPDPTEHVNIVQRAARLAKGRPFLVMGQSAVPVGLESGAVKGTASKGRGGGAFWLTAVSGMMLPVKVLRDGDVDTMSYEEFLAWTAACPKRAKAKGN